MHDSDVIKAFVSYRRDSDCPGLEIESWPDRENRTTPEIDAIAGRFAIEHTSIDSLADQRLVSAWFEEAIGRLESDIRIDYCRLRLCVPYGAVRRKQNRPEIRRHLASWIRSDAQKLPDGVHPKLRIPGVPFAIDVERRSDQPPGLFISRPTPKDVSLANRLLSLMTRKARKLDRYASRGMTRLLLLENDDIALMNDEKLRDAVKEAVRRSGEIGVDELWYADTSILAFLRFENFSDCLGGDAA